MKDFKVVLDGEKTTLILPFPTNRSMGLAWFLYNQCYDKKVIGWKQLRDILLKTDNVILVKE